MAVAKSKKNKAPKTAVPVGCSKEEIVIQRCPDRNGSFACILSQDADKTCQIEPTGGTTGSFRQISGEYLTLRIYRPKRTKTLKVEYVPQGITNFEFYKVRRLEMHDIVFPEGLKYLRFKFTNLPPYPSDKFKNITLPKSMEALYFDNMVIDSLDPSEWRNVPLKTVSFFKTTVQSFDRAVFPPSISTLQIRYSNVSTLETSTLPTALKTMNLEYNQFSTVESIPMDNLHDLSYLILDGNPIHTLGERSSIPSSLQNLSMADCGLSDISDKFVFPPNLVSLDFSNNHLESFPLTKLPKSLTTLHLDSNPLKEFNINDLDVLNFLKKLDAFDATTDNVQCNTSYTKTIVRGKIYACVSQNIRVNIAETKSQQLISKTKISTSTTVFIVVLACVVAAALVLMFVFRVMKRRRSRLANQSELDSFDESTKSSMATFELSKPPREIEPAAKFAKGEGEMTKPTASSGSVVSISPWHDPTFINNDATLAAFRLADDSINNLIPMMGNYYSGVYMGQRVMLVALPLQDGEAIAHLLVRTKHPKLLTFHGFVHGLADETLVVMEWMDGGSLDALLCKSLLLGFMQKIVIALDVIAALVYLHDTVGSSHCHLSTHTVWLTDAGRAKLSLVSGVQPSETIWQPETESEEKSPSTDVYSFGVLLLTLQRQSVPSIHNIEAARSLPIEDDMEILSIDWFRLSCPDKLRTLASQCLQLEASRRPSASEIHTAIRAMMDEVLEAEMASDVQSTVLQLTVLESMGPPPSSTSSDNPNNAAVGNDQVEQVP
ncbi:hypothetical protein LEN26_012590 [Aphanomyces euteiches]|nr:hypothetical protein LEN26_012590 [Aphanomyces euteiches]